MISDGQFERQVEEDLGNRYDVKELHRNVEKILRRKRPDAAWLLRHHEDEVIKHDEVQQREELDQLLSAWSAMFIGGAVPASDRQLRRSNPVHAVLNHPDVARYYEKHYPIAVPALLNATYEERLSEAFTSIVSRERAAEGWRDCYMRFLELDGAFSVESPFTDFMALLDELKVRGYWLNDLRRALESPEELEEWLEAKSGQRLLEGFQDFFEFSEALDELLGEMRDLPVHRGLFWLHFGYWYGGGGKRMRRAAGWLASTLDSYRNIDDTADPAVLGELIDRLTDVQSYAGETIALAGPVLDRWRKHALPGSMRADRSSSTLE